MVRFISSNEDQELITDQIRNLLQKLSEIEILPHHFDETLLDKLFELIKFSDQTIVQILEDDISARSVFEQSSSYIFVILRLLSTAVEAKQLIPSNGTFSSFFTELPTFLFQSRPPFVIGAVFRLYTVSIPFHLEWNHTVRWAVENFSDSAEAYTRGAYKMTVFVRAKIEEFLKSIPYSEDLEAYFAILSKSFEQTPVTDSPFVLNSIMRIAAVHQTYFKRKWNAQQIFQNLLVSYPTGRGLGYEIFDYLCEHLTLTPDLLDNFRQYPLFSVNFFHRYFHKFEKLPGGVDEIILTYCTLEQLGPFLPYFCQQHFLDIFLKKTFEWINDSRRTNSTSLLRFLEVIFQFATDDQIIPFIELCHHLVARSPAILRFIRREKKHLLNPEQCPLLYKDTSEIVQNIFCNDELDEEWEEIETAFEIGECIPSLIDSVEIDDKFLFNENEYVAVAALKSVITRSNEDFDICVRIIKDGIHSQSKLIALNHLENGYPISSKHCELILLDGLEDDDNENRWSAFQIGKHLFNDNLGGEVLEKYIDDYLIGSEIRQLLNLAPLVLPNPLLKTLDEIISGLDMVYVDVPDCS